MNRVGIEDAGILDAHLDDMLRLAFMYEDVLMANEAEKARRREYSEEEKAMFRTAFIRAKEKYRQEEKQRVREKRNRVIRAHAKRAMKAAAAILVIISLIAPFAIANVESIRVRVMKLLIEIQEDHADISIQEDEAASFDVPAEWRGEYFPSYIPEGYSMSKIYKIYDHIEYENQEGDRISFIEYTEDTQIGADTEDAEISYSQINGNTAIVIHKGEWQIIWTNGEKIIEVIADDYDVAMKVANSVKRVNI